MMKKIVQIACIGCLLSTLIMGASAVSVTASPDSIQKGETVTVSLSDIPDGAPFSLRIDATFAVSPGSEFAFRAEDFVMPISLKDSTVSASTENAQEILLEVKPSDGKMIRMIDDEKYSVTLNKNIGAGTYDHLILGGTAGEKSTEIRTSMSLTGEKQGPKDSAITFRVAGITDGIVTVTALVDGHKELAKEITIGQGIVPTPTTSRPSNPSGPSGPGNPGARTTPTPLPEKYSTDGVVHVLGEDAPGISVLTTQTPTVPEEWQAVTGTYLLNPQEKTFSQIVTLTFRLPQKVAADPDAYTLFLAEYADEEWTALPSSIDGDEISATIRNGGTYALMTFARAEVPSATVAAAAHGQADTSEEPLTTTVTPAPTQSPTGILAAIGAIVGTLYIAGTRKRL
ncbi:hypothetical protein J2129_002510 [Methanofollis sp. W23]|uniref:hypothetical protein n=1 Tax=Methanofollis sp. W23 TaxID=2817849 RepID=UPI001AE157FA|nr:hypothetical protein [Methanofollis sp. W23]MBP2147056.1 hypothetical protein [Methanofollis sp. W23]